MELATIWNRTLIPFFGESLTMDPSYAKASAGMHGPRCTKMNSYRKGQVRNRNPSLLAGALA